MQIFEQENNLVPKGPAFISGLFKLGKLDKYYRSFPLANMNCFREAA